MALCYDHNQIIIPPLPEGGGGILFLYPRSPGGMGYAVFIPPLPKGGGGYTVLPLSVAFFSATIDGRNLIFGHKLHIGMPYCEKRFWTRQIPTSYLPT